MGERVWDVLKIVVLREVLEAVGGLKKDDWALDTSFGFVCLLE